MADSVCNYKERLFLWPFLDDDEEKEVEVLERGMGTENSSESKNEGG